MANLLWVSVVTLGRHNAIAHDVRLISATITGIGRLVATKINLDTKVVAIVGPNEAGKSTLLRALAYLDDEPTGALHAIHHSREVEITKRTLVVSAEYILEEQDLQNIDSILLIKDKPSRVTISKTAGGTRVTEIRPSIEKSPKVLVDASDILTRFLEDPEAKPLEEMADKDADKSPSNTATRLVRLIAEIETIARNPQQKITPELLSEATAVRDRLRRIKGIHPRVLRALNAAVLWLNTEPSDGILEAIQARRPQFLLFDEEQRQLHSSYIVDEETASNPPKPLRNISNLADLDLQLLFTALRTGNHTSRATLLHRANKTLRERTKAAWKQSDVAIKLDLQGSELNIQILEDDSVVTVFEERSAGLRAFAAMLAFVSDRKLAVPPILLIDEAENHLHYDAQADLVQMFSTQEQASKIIYTTHSPGCLPADLGTSVRTVLPSPDTPGVSEVRNSFWQHGPGFSPLMLAMGAGAAAFTPARLVVLAEGPSEMLLLPSLIKHAIDAKKLEYQIAPGLSAASPTIYRDLDLEGARVVFLVDGDQGGKDLRRKLIQNNVDATRVILLEASTLENLLDPSVYREVVRELMRESSGNTAIPPLPELGGIDSDPWPNQLAKWASSHGLALPSKVAVASRLVETSRAQASKEGQIVLRALHDTILSTLK
ncbi:AAA family ATPase [Streptomyces gardneri]|nr:AAA family ATPase [Streptomyces gardneri]